MMFPRFFPLFHSTAPLHLCDLSTVSEKPFEWKYSEINLKFPPEVPICLHFWSWSVMKLVSNQNLRETNCFTAFSVIFHSQGIFFQSEKFFLRLFFLFLHEQTLQFSYEHHQTRNPISCNVISRRERKRTSGREKVEKEHRAGEIKDVFPPSMSGNASERDSASADKRFSPKIARVRCLEDSLLSQATYSARNSIKVHYKEHKFICPSVFSLWASNNTRGPEFSL